MPQNVTRSAESRLLSYDRKARAELGTAALLAFLAVAAAVGFAFVLSRIIARVFIDAATLSDVHALLFLLCALALLRAGLLWASEVASQSAANRLKDALATDVLDHIARLGPAYIHRQQSGELAHTVAQGVEQLDEYVTSYQPLRALAVLVPLFVASVVLLVDPWSVLILVLTGPLLVLFLVLIGGRTREITERRSSEMAWMSASFVNLLQGLATLKLFGRSSEQTANIREISKRYSDTSMTVLRTAFETSFVLELGASIAMALVAVEIGIRLLADNIAFANALAVLIITPEFFLPLRQLATKYHAGAAGKAAATRLFAILDTSPGGDRAAPAAAYAQSSGGDIRLVDIAFSYDVDRTPALDGVSLEIPAGRVTALVGPTGSGKSTIANLLLRFVEAGTGTIFVDGTPLSAIGVEHWRSQVSWVPQHPHLFYGTVIENIRLGRASATDDEVVAAARAAQAHEFITELPNGYETPIGERGARLSGGEKQRVAIARAFLKDAPLLILDEPTSHLDAENESSIRDALGTLMRGRTVLLISHRPELASLADHVVEMRRGRVARRDAPPPSSDEASPAAMDPAVLLLPNTGGTL